MKAILKFWSAILFLALISPVQAQSPVLVFDGVNDYVNLGTSIGNNARTFELWFNLASPVTPSLNQYSSLICRETSGNNVNEFSLGFVPSGWNNPGTIRFQVSEIQGSEYTVYSNQNSWNANQWHHVAGVIDQTTGMRLFIDGILQLSLNSYTLAPATAPDITTIGCYGNGYNRYFHGMIEDVRISSSAMYSSSFTPPCPDQILTSTTTGLFNFNTGSGNIAHNSVSNSTDGVIVGASWGSATICGEERGNVLFFDGIDDYVDLGASIGNSGIRTIEMWFRPESYIDPSLSEFSTLIGRETTGGNINEFTMGFQPNSYNNSGQLRFRITPIQYSEQTVYSNQNTWNPNQWYHVAGVVDPNLGMRLYIDGVLQSSTNTYTSPPASAPYLTAIGCYGKLFSRNFHGSIDDVRFSNTALYSTNFTPPCPDILTNSNSVGLYNFNEMIGGTAIDSSVYSNHGLIVGASRISAFICSDTTTFINEHLVKISKVHIFPNPVEEYLTIEFEEIASSNYRLEIINPLGQVIHYEDNVKSGISIKRHSSIKSGLYFYTLKQDRKIIYSGKIVFK